MSEPETQPSTPSQPLVDPIEIFKQATEAIDGASREEVLTGLNAAELALREQSEADEDKTDD